MSRSQRSEQSATLRPARVPRRSFWLQYLSLFSSLGTLLCCALPSLLVLFGLGATVASVLSAAPWLVALSRHKNWVFAVAGTLIGANFLYVYALAPRLSSVCPADANGACATASRMRRIVIRTSSILYCTVMFSSYELVQL